MSKFNNMFDALAQDEEVDTTQQFKYQEKKPVQKKTQAPRENAGNQGAQPRQEREVNPAGSGYGDQTQGYQGRGSRGRGGYQGGYNEDRQDYYQEKRGGDYRGSYRGSRGGRGRGRGGYQGEGEQQYRPKTTGYEGEGGAVEEVEGEAGKDVSHNFGHKGYRHGYAGKPREEYHPYDRHDGSGRGRGGFKKDGAGRGNWGNEVLVYKKKGDPDPEYVPEVYERRERRERREEPVYEQPEAQEGEVVEQPKEEEKEPRVYDDKRRERRRYDDEESKPVEVEEEVKGLTYEEFKAQQDAKKKNLKKAEVRQHENVTAKNIEKVEKINQKVTGIDSQVNANDLYNAGILRGENADLLGFQGGVDEEEFGGERRRGGFRGGRGDRGGFRGGDRGDRGAYRGGRGERGGERGGYRGDRGGRGKKLVFNEDAFPTL